MKKVFRKNNDGEVRLLKEGLKHAFKDIKNEFEHHLETINQNTSELQGLYEYMNELENKIVKLNERLDEMQLTVNPDLSYDQFAVELTHREQEVFVLLYAERENLSALDMARRLGFTEEMVHRYAYNLISKGIPVLKNYVDSTLYYSLDNRFKDLQARKNVLKIDEGISQQLLSEKAI